MSIPVTKWGVTGAMAWVVVEGSTRLAVLLGLEFVKEGQYVTVAGTHYWIEEICSGFNFLLAHLTLVLPLIALTNRSWARLLGLALTIIPVTLATKMLLVTTTLMLTPGFSVDLAVSLYHRWLGIPAFAVGLWVLLLVTMKTSVRKRCLPVV